MGDVITNGGPDRRYKVCRCGWCGIEATCTPSRDFFTRPGDPTGPLYCWGCLLAANKMPAQHEPSAPKVSA